MVKILVASRRPCDSDALATSSYGMNFAHPLSAATFVSAAVSVVFPWSMCPIVPTFTCGLDRSNFSFAMCAALRSLVRSSVAQGFSPALHGRPEGLRYITGNRQPVTGLHLALHSCDDFLADVLRRLLVGIEVHAVGRAALGARPEVGGVPEHLRQRHTGVHDLRAAPVVLR